MTTAVPTPEHDKLLANREAHEAIQEFLEMLSSEGITLHKLSDYQPYQTMPNYDEVRPEAAIARFFDVDPMKLEAEKRALLASLRG